jgi:hypothetical protein
MKDTLLGPGKVELQHVGVDKDAIELTRKVIAQNEIILRMNERIIQSVSSPLFIINPPAADEMR